MGLGCVPVNLCDSCLFPVGAETFGEALWIREEAVVAVNFIRHLALQQEIVRNCVDKYQLTI